MSLPLRQMKHPQTVSVLFHALKDELTAFVEQNLLLIWLWMFLL